MGVEMLRGVYTERSECAQHDSAVTHTDARINVFMCIIGPQWAFLYPYYFLKLHYRAHRRFIGPRWVFLYPDYYLKLHNRHTTVSLPQC